MQNTYRRGLIACPITMLPFENIADFLELANGLRDEHKPTTITEDALVTKMIEGLWFSARAAKLQQRILLDPKFNQAQFDSLGRYQSQQDRAFSRALADLRTFRKTNRELEIGFVSQKRKEERHTVHIRHMQTGTEAREIAISYAKVRNARYFAHAPAAEPTPIAA